MKEVAALPTSSNEDAILHQADVTLPESAQTDVNDSKARDSDDEPMIYRTSHDYATWARHERDRRLAEGADPDSVILQSKVRKHVPRQEGESSSDYVERWSETMNAMIRRGVVILNDQSTANTVPTGFGIPGGTYFNLGPTSGATKREYREFVEWHSSLSKAEGNLEVPERWLRFVKPRPSIEKSGA